MSAKLIVAQAIAVTIGVVGAAMIARDIDRKTKANSNKNGVGYEKIYIFELSFFFHRGGPAKANQYNKIRRFVNILIVPKFRRLCPISQIRADYPHRK